MHSSLVSSDSLRNQQAPVQGDGLIRRAIGDQVAVIVGRGAAGRLNRSKRPGLEDANDRRAGRIVQGSALGMLAIRLAYASTVASSVAGTGSAGGNVGRIRR